LEKVRSFGDSVKKGKGEEEWRNFGHLKDE
jgi:hypothetical protein